MHACFLTSKIVLPVGILMRISLVDLEFKYIIISRKWCLKYLILFAFETETHESGGSTCGSDRSRGCMTAEADSEKSLNKVAKHGSCWSWFY